MNRRLAAAWLVAAAAALQGCATLAVGGGFGERTVMAVHYERVIRDGDRLVLLAHVDVENELILGSVVSHEKGRWGVVELSRLRTAPLEKNLSVIPWEWIQVGHGARPSLPAGDVVPLYELSITLGEGEAIASLHDSAGADPLAVYRQERIGTVIAVTTPGERRRSEFSRIGWPVPKRAWWAVPARVVLCPVIVPFDLVFTPWFLAELWSERGHGW